MKSIRNRLTILIVVGSLALLVMAGLAIDRMLYTQLEEEFDRNLLQTARTLVSLSEQEDGILEFDYDPELMPHFDSEDHPLFFQLWLASGEVFARSPSLGREDLNRAVVASTVPVFSTKMSSNGDRMRSVEFLYEPVEDIEDDESDLAEKVNDNDALKENTAGQDSDGAAIKPLQAYLKVARKTDELEVLATTIRSILFGGFAVLMLALILLVRFAITRGLGPLLSISHQVQQLDEQSLHLRVHPGTETEELTPITEQLNRLLERLEQAFDREKRFSGNVAHELRTPIAELRTLAEVGREWPEEKAMVEVFFGDLVNLADDMERTVANLLTLARVDAGNQTVNEESILLHSLVQNLVDRFLPSAGKRDMQIENGVDKNLLIRSDADKLKLILINLLANAITYGVERSTIVVSAQYNDGDIKLEVSNSTDVLTDGDLPLLFERFWRKDAARSSGGNHAGIGLSLVAALADVMGLVLKSNLDNNNRFTLSLSNINTAM